MMTHHDDHKVKPAPGVSEVLDEAEGEPLDDHLHGEDHSKDSVHVVEDVLQDRPLRQVNVLRSLKQPGDESRSPGGGNTDQREAADEDHGNHRGLKIFIFYQTEGFDSQICPALPKR